MSWIRDIPLNYFQKFCVNVLKNGPVPKHVAFIMDGNRRYARKTNVERLEGHSKGFEKLTETLQWCLDLGINEVTVYAFSIENFKRSKEEVDALMKLAEEKFRRLLEEEREKIMEEGVCIRIIGNLELLPPELRKLLARTILLTKDNKRAILNVAFAYTSSDEITTSMQTIAEGVNNNLIDLSDITQDLISQTLYTKQSPNPDLIIRTSGETRFSNFLLWQISRSTLVCFMDVLWPEFSVWNLLGCVFKYQLSCRNNNVENAKKYASNNTIEVQGFLDYVERKRISQLECYVKA